MESQLNSFTCYSITQWLSSSQDGAEIIAWDKHSEVNRAQFKQDITHLYSQLGCLPLRRIALCFEDHYFFLVALLACLYAGKTPVLLGHKKPARFVEQHYCFDYLLGDLSPIANVQQLSCGELINESIIHQALPPLNTAQTIELYTSGSTGHPKKVVKSLAMMDAEINLLLPLFESRMSECRLVASVPPFHLYGLTFSVWLPMSIRLPISRHMLIYTEQYAALPNDVRYVFISSPAFLKRLDTELPAPETAIVFSSGGQLNSKAVQETLSWLQIGIDEIYGSSETGVIAHRFRDGTQQPWQSLPGISFMLRSQGWQVNSPLLEQSTSIELDDDLCFIDPYHFDVIGRQSRLIKLEEKRISLDEIEQRILNLNGIVDVAVIQVERHHRPRLAALIVISPALVADWQTQRQSIEQQWRAELGQYLDGIAIPRYWRCVSVIPTNDMNKRQESLLQELFIETV